MIKNKILPALVLLTVLSACDQSESETGKKAKDAKEYVEQKVEAVVNAVKGVSSDSFKETSFDGFAPHKALYDFKLISAKRNSQIANVSGRMAFEWDDACDAWTTNQNYKIRYDYTEGMPTEMTSNFATWENKEGTVFQFTASRFRETEKIEDIRGSVQRLEDGKLDVSFKLPEGVTFDIPVGTLFPTQHTEHLIGVAQKGEKFFSSVLFDGSDTEGPVDVSAFVTKVAEPPKEVLERKEIDKDLIKPKAWSVRMAFFPRQTATDPNAEVSETSDYEMTMILHENGVISDISIDYSEFSLHSSLSALEKIDPADCE